MINFFTKKEICEIYGITINSLEHRMKMLQISTKKIKRNSREGFLSKDEVEMIINYTFEKKENFSKIIYVTQTYLILPSKMNYESI